MRLSLAVFVTVAAIGCSEAGDGADDGIAVVVDSIDGILHVRSSGVAPQWHATETLRIGAPQGGPAEFGRIRSVIADADRNVYVADNLANEIRVFHSSGEYLRTIGRRGAGPGEFGDLYSLAWIGKYLAAMDPRNARIAIVTMSGEWINGIRHYPITGPPSLVRLHPLDTAGFYAPIIGTQGQIPFVRFTTSGPPDTLFSPQAPQGARRTGVICRRPDGGVTGIAVPDAPTITYAFAPQGGTIAVSWTESYRIAVLDRHGDTLRVFTREQAPVPYADTTWANAMRPLRELQRAFPGSRCEPDAPSRPPSRAALRHMLFDESGKLWVEAAHESGFVWDVFDEAGRMVGRAPAPPRTAGIPPYIRGDHLYQVEQDSLDVQYVVVYRLHSAK